MVSPAPRPVIAVFKVRVPGVSLSKRIRLPGVLTAKIVAARTGAAKTTSKSATATNENRNEWRVDVFIESPRANRRTAIQAI